ncbi:MAG TPA: hypothetical protein VKR21_16490 [Solirubrobacteraceae bacterium]|nr:hypothetical protein [Solirubrobacteraceae bacterium]
MFSGRVGVNGAIGDDRWIELARHTDYDGHGVALSQRSREP